MDKAVLVKNGLVVDGCGAPAFEGDVLVRGDRIEAVARKGAGDCGIAGLRDCETIDAAGCIVSPGFIDSHTHSDAYLVIEPDAPSKIAQGITTEINGQCGGSAAPRYGEARLSSDWAAVLGDRLTWHSMAEYREALEQARPAVNTVQFVGHNTLRSSVVGYAGRAATPDELAGMQTLLAKSMDEGAWGLTTGLIYQPGRYSTPEEIAALARVAAERGGIYATHMRSEGDAILEAIDEVVNLARATGIRAEISHLKTGGRANWGKIDAVLEKVQSAIDEGVVLGSDRYPYCAAGTDLDIVLPDWAQEGAAKAEMERLADSSLRRRIVDEINASGRDWSEVMIGGTWSPETRPYSGRTIAEILSSPLPNSSTPPLPQSHNSIIPQFHNSIIPNSPGELVCRILELDGCKTGAFFFTMCEENLDKILSRPWIVPGSDASLRAPWGPLGKDHPHPRAYATMPMFLARLRGLGVSLEEAVARMTSVPARRFGLAGRGVVEKGAFADIVVWKDGEFASDSTYKEPHVFAQGVECVMVNGAVTYRAGRFTGERAGRFLERTARGG